MKTYNNEIKYLKNVRKLLINIDMVNGFVKEGALAAPSIMRVVPRQIKLLEKGLNDDESGIVFIRDAHPSNAVEFNNYPAHCIIGTKESELIDELKRFEPFALEYLKNSTSLIFAPGIQNDLLSLQNLREIELMGCLSEVCVQNGGIDLKNFFNQYNRAVDICVHADAIDTFDREGHKANIVTENALKLMENNGIKVLKKEMK